MLCLELEPLNNRPSSSLRSASFCDPFPSLHPPQPSRARKGRQRRPPENGAQVPRLLSRDSEPAHEPKARGRHDVRGRVWKLPARAQELGGTGRHFPPPNSHGHKAGRDCCCLRRSGYLGLRRRPYRTHSSAKGVQKRRQNRQCTPLGQPRQPTSEHHRQQSVNLRFPCRHQRRHRHTCATESVGQCFRPRVGKHRRPFRRLSTYHVFCIDPCQAHSRAHSD